MKNVANIKDHGSWAEPKVDPDEQAYFDAVGKALEDMAFLKALLRERNPGEEVEVWIMSNDSIGFAVTHQNGEISKGHCFRTHLDMLKAGMLKV